MKKSLLHRSALICFFLSTFAFNASAQFKINQFIQPDTLSFDSFAATGLQASPAAGELNSTFWRIKGLSDGNTIFGGTYTTGDYARGISGGGESIGGIYAFNNGLTDPMLGIQPIGSDFTPGSITLKIQNNTTQIIKDLVISYDVWFLNNEDRASSFDFYYSSNDTIYYRDTTVNTSSPEIADTLGWKSFSKISTMKDVNIAVGDLFYIQWRGDDLSGTGSRDEFGLDDVIIQAEEANTTPIAKIQLIHNSAAILLDTIDVYIDDSLLIDNMEFRTASNFISLPAAENLRLSIAPSNSTDTNNTYSATSINLKSGKNYIGVIHGLFGSGYNPSSIDYPLSLSLKQGGREIALNVGNTDILFFHSCTDLGPLDIEETSLPAGLILDNVVYGIYEGYNEYVTDNYSIAINDSTSSTNYYNYPLTLNAFKLLDSAIVVVSSGFHDPTLNNNGTAFDLLYAPAIGGKLISFNSKITSANSIVNKPEDILLIYPNPAKNYLFIQNNKEADAVIKIYNILGETVLTETFSGKLEKLDISTLPKGSYILKYISKKTISSKVFVK